MVGGGHLTMCAMCRRKNCACQITGSRHIVITYFSPGLTPQTGLRQGQSSSGEAISWRERQDSDQALDTKIKNRTTLDATCLNMPVPDDVCPMCRRKNCLYQTHGRQTGGPDYYPTLAHGSHRPPRWGSWICNFGRRQSPCELILC
jgi:hypothetical protein